MTVRVRTMQADDRAAVERIYKAHVAPGRRQPRRALLARIDEALAAAERAVALVAVDEGDRVAGYLVGDVRSWEFGSEPAGWIFAIGVDPRAGRQGLGGLLVDEARRRFAALGLRTVRTMVRRDDVPVLRFFRGEHFSAGPYLELELPLAPVRQAAEATS